MWTIITLIIACIAAAFVPEWVIKFSEKYLDAPLTKYFKNHPEKDSGIIKELTILPKYMGRIERPLYVVVYYLKQPEFIGLWLTLKIAGDWKLWNPTNDEDAHIGRARFMVFLMKSGLSIAGAVAIALFAMWFITNKIQTKTVTYPPAQVCTVSCRLPYVNFTQN